MIVAPIAAMLIQMAISRSREYMADEGGAQISGKPLALASALNKLQRGNELVPMKNAADFFRPYVYSEPTQRKIIDETLLNSSSY